MNSRVSHSLEIEISIQHDIMKARKIFPLQCLGRGVPRQYSILLPKNKNHSLVNNQTTSLCCERHPTAKFRRGKTTMKQAVIIDKIWRTRSGSIKFVLQCFAGGVTLHFSVSLMCYIEFSFTFDISKSARVGGGGLHYSGVK